MENSSRVQTVKLVWWCFYMDLLLAGSMFVVFVVIRAANKLFEDIVRITYLGYIEQHPRPYFPDSCERLLNLLMMVYVVIFYVLYRLREHERMRNLLDIRQQTEYEALFRLETGFMEQLRSHGILLQDPQSEYPDSSSA
ncbi:hypothetical protein KR009_005140 [Drosophila setifemur]|nr:hypothetical protein KR009_005140 [Drosophila setifemur]